MPDFPERFEDLTVDTSEQDAALERVLAVIARHQALRDQLQSLQGTDFATYPWPQNKGATEPTMNKNIDVAGSAIRYLKLAAAMVATAGLVVVALLAALYNLYVVFSGKESLAQLLIATPLLVVLLAGCLAVIGAWGRWLDQ